MFSRHMQFVVMVKQRITLQQCLSSDISGTIYLSGQMTEEKTTQEVQEAPMFQ